MDEYEGLEDEDDFGGARLVADHVAGGMHIEVFQGEDDEYTLYIDNQAAASYSGKELEVVAQAVGISLEVLDQIRASIREYGKSQSLLSRSQRVDLKWYYIDQLDSLISNYVVNLVSGNQNDGDLWLESAEYADQDDGDEFGGERHLMTLDVGGQRVEIYQKGDEYDAKIDGISLRDAKPAQLMQLCAALGISLTGRSDDDLMQVGHRLTKLMDAPIQEHVLWRGKIGPCLIEHSYCDRGEGWSKAIYIDGVLLDRYPYDSQKLAAISAAIGKDARSSLHSYLDALSRGTLVEDEYDELEDEDKFGSGRIVGIGTVAGHEIALLRGDGEREGGIECWIDHLRLCDIQSENQVPARVVTEIGEALGMPSVAAYAERRAANIKQRMEYASEPAREQYQRMLDEVTSQELFNEYIYNLIGELWHRQQMGREPFNQQD